MFLNVFSFLKALDSLQSWPIEKIWNENIIDLILENTLPNLLRNSYGNNTTRPFSVIWQKAFTKYPWELSIKTVNALLHFNGSNGKNSNRFELTHSMNVENPLLLFRIDQKLLRKPFVVQIFLQILNCYTLACRRQFITQEKLNPNKAEGRKFQKKKKKRS